MILYAFFIFINSLVYGQDLSLLRKNLSKAPDNKKICKTMIDSITTTKDPVYLAYLGAYQTIWANHVINPISKLSTFNKGKKNIENAFLLDQNNIEIRLIRYSIQNNAPKFLGYSSELIRDKNFIERNYQDVKSIELKELINSVL